MTIKNEKPDRLLAFEDFEIGATIPIGPRHITAEEIIEFASEFDPQPMHVDAEAGQASLLGGLGASGWHICAMAMRMFCDAYLLNSLSQGAPGVEYVKWKKPIIAGDTLAGTSTVVSKRVSKSRPDLGFVTLEHRLTNQCGETVTDIRNTGMLALRGDAS